MMSRQLEDADGNRQGLTIAEFGELGGPGMGGCPTGPADSVAPKARHGAVVRSSDKTVVEVRWAAAVAHPARRRSGATSGGDRTGRTAPGHHETWAAAPPRTRPR